MYSYIAFFVQYSLLEILLAPVGAAASSPEPRPSPAPVSIARREGVRFCEATISTDCMSKDVADRRLIAAWLNKMRPAKRGQEVV